MLAALLACAAVIWVGSGVISEPAMTKTVAPEETSPAEKPLVNVRIAELEAVDRPLSVTVTGRTNAIKDAEIKAETSGNVVARKARKGSFVKKGAVLLELAMNDRMDRLEEAKAQVGSATISFNASKDLQRKQFESQVRLAQSNAELAKAEAELAAIELDIARTRIRAPIDGYVERLLPGPGDYVEEGDEVAMVVDLDPIRVIVNVTEMDVGHLKVDDLAAVRLPNGQEIGGTIHYISRVANETTRTFRVDVWIDNPDASIPAGLTASVKLEAGAQRAHKIPSSALTLNDKGTLGVRIVDEANIVQFVPVTMLDDTPDGTWVSGLPTTVRLITVGQEFVVDGQSVAPISDAIAEGEGGDQS